MEVVQNISQRAFKFVNVSLICKHKPHGMKKAISTLLTVLLTLSVFAQEKQGHWCTAQTSLQSVYKEHKDEILPYEAQLDNLAYSINTQDISDNKDRLDNGYTFYIPVVFHVFHKEGDAPLTADKVDDFIDGLNKNFNPTPEEIEEKKKRVQIAEEYKDVIGTGNIKFLLAERDPQGNETSGINYYVWEGTDGSGTVRDEVKYQAQWKPKSYLNFWVVDRIGAFDDNPDQQVLGFATLPSFVASGITPIATDGVVIRKDQVNSSSTTGTHEVGHYLGLRHPFQGDGIDEEEGGCSQRDCRFGGDKICDLDQALEPRWDCNANANTCPLDDRKDPAANYMMYTQDRCHHMFSKEQVVRMRSTLLSHREELSSWGNLIQTGLGEFSTSKMVYDANVYPNPFNEKLNVVVNSDSEQQICISIKDLLGRTVHKDCKKRLSTGSNTLILSANELNLEERGVYLLELQLSDQIIISRIKYEE